MYSFVIGGLAAILYLVSGSLLGVRLSKAGTQVEWNKTGLVALGAVAVVLHGLLLAPEMLEPQGINLGFFNALSFVAWLMAAVLVVLAIVKPVENLGIILLPFSAITLLLALLFPSQRLVSESSPWPLEAHIVISIMAYSVLSMAAVQALLLSIQDHHLRTRRGLGFSRGLPPLMLMESLLFQMITVGFILLSLALLSGFLFLEDMFAQRLVHKTILSILAWLLFGILLIGRWRYGWRGGMAIRWLLGGFISLMLSYFGSKLVLELILQR